MRGDPERERVVIDGLWGTTDEYVPWITHPEDPVPVPIMQSGPW